MRLTNINLPESLENMGANLFPSSAITFLVSPDHPYFAAIDEVLYQKQKRVLVSYPTSKQNAKYDVVEGTLSIGDWAFSSCDSLNNINLPEGLQSIGHEAFSRCGGLNSIELPESLQSIGYRTFSDCYNLSSIRLPENLQNIGDDAFSNIADDAVFTVPRGSYAETWAEQTGVDYQYSD